MLIRSSPRSIAEYARLVAAFLELHGVRVVLSDGVAGFKRSKNGVIAVSDQSGGRIPPTS